MGVTFECIPIGVEVELRDQILCSERLESRVD